MIYPYELNTLMYTKAQSKEAPDAPAVVLKRIAVVVGADVQAGVMTILLFAVEI
jgi:hypothetical protein